MVCPSPHAEKAACAHLWHATTRLHASAVLLLWLLMVCPSSSTQYSHSRAHTHSTSARRCSYDITSMLGLLALRPSVLSSRPCTRCGGQGRGGGQREGLVEWAERAGRVMHRVALIAQGGCCADWPWLHREGAAQVAPRHIFNYTGAFPNPKHAMSRTPGPPNLASLRAFHYTHPHRGLTHACNRHTLKHMLARTHAHTRAHTHILHTHTSNAHAMRRTTSHGCIWSTCPIPCATPKRRWCGPHILFVPSAAQCSFVCCSWPVNHGKMVRTNLATATRCEQGPKLVPTSSMEAHLSEKAEPRRLLPMCHSSLLPLCHSSLQGAALHFLACTCCATCCTSPPAPAAQRAALPRPHLLRDALLGVAAIRHWPQRGRVDELVDLVRPVLDQSGGAHHQAHVGAACVRPALRLRPGKKRACAYEGLAPQRPEAHTTETRGSQGKSEAYSAQTSSHSRNQRPHPTQHCYDAHTQARGHAKHCPAAGTQAGSAIHVGADTHTHRGRMGMQSSSSTLHYLGY